MKQPSKKRVSLLLPMLVALVGCETQTGLLLIVDGDVDGTKLQILVGDTHLVPIAAPNSPGRWLDTEPEGTFDVAGRDLRQEPYRYYIARAAPLDRPPFDTTDEKISGIDGVALAAALLDDQDQVIAYAIATNPVTIPTDVVAMHKLTLIAVPPGSKTSDCLFNDNGSLVVGSDEFCGTPDACLVEPTQPGCVDCGADPNDPQCCAPDLPLTSNSPVYEVCDGVSNACDDTSVHAVESRCYSMVADECNVGTVSCDDSPGGVGVELGCGSLTPLNPVTVDGAQITGAGLCGAYMNTCSGRADRTACTHALVATRTLVCQPRHDDDGTCGDEYVPTDVNAQDCILTVVGLGAVEGWTVGFDGQATSGVQPACSAALKFLDPPPLSQEVQQHTELLVFQSSFDGSMNANLDFIRVIILPEYDFECANPPPTVCEEI